MAPIWFLDRKNADSWLQIPNRMKWYCFVVLLLLGQATTKNKTVETLFDLIINQMRKEFFKMAGGLTRPFKTKLIFFV